MLERLVVAVRESVTVGLNQMTKKTLHSIELYLINKGNKKKSCN